MLTSFPSCRVREGVLVGDVVAGSRPVGVRLCAQHVEGVTLAGLDDRGSTRPCPRWRAPGRCGGSRRGPVQRFLPHRWRWRRCARAARSTRVSSPTMAPGNRAAMASSCACSQASSSFSSSVIPDEVVVELGAVAADQGESSTPATSERATRPARSVRARRRPPPSSYRCRSQLDGAASARRSARASAGWGDDRRQASVEIRKRRRSGAGSRKRAGRRQVVRGDRIRSFLAGVAQRVEEALRPLLDVVGEGPGDVARACGPGLRHGFG